MFVFFFCCFSFLFLHMTFWNDYLMHYIGLSLGVCVCVCVVCVYLGVCVYGCLVRFNRYIGTSVLFVDAACNGSLLLFPLKIYIYFCCMYIKLYFIDIILCFSYKKIVIIIVNLFYKLRLINMIKKNEKKNIIS